MNNTKEERLIRCVDMLLRRIERLEWAVLTREIKDGYGLTPDDELKLNAEVLSLMKQV